MEYHGNLSEVGGVSLGGIDRLIERLAANVLTWAVALVALVAVAVYVLGKLRAPPAQHERPASDLMSKFREMHSRGELSAEEFRTIKTTLAVRLEDELKDNGEKG